MAIEQLSDEDYANLLFHETEDQLYRQQQLEQFITSYSSTILELWFHLLASDKLPNNIHHEFLETSIRSMKDAWYNICSVNGTEAVPYHDDVLFCQYTVDLISNVKSTSPTFLDPVQPWKVQDEHLSKMLKELYGIYPDFALINELSYPFQLFYKYFSSLKLSYLYSRFQLLLTQAGYKVGKLGILQGRCHANSVLPPENGYTRVFCSNEIITQEQLRDELLSRNDSIEIERLSVPDSTCITVAVSYKHYADRNDEKLTQRDIEAIHRFLIASQPCRVRFWIDSKLPSTDDASFDRWLKRGVRPYARYFTLVCPSAFEETNRYWIQMERHIAMAAQGIFDVTQDGIYYKKEFCYYRKLCHQILRLMVGREGSPPGLRKQDEGKMVQWALGFLGDKDSVKLHQVRGPRVDSLCNRDYQEFTVMRNITYIIKEHGAIELPVETGRSWNKDNPLILKGIPDQILLLPTWIGFAKMTEPRKVYFVNGSILTQVVHGAVVGLEVTLRHPFKNGEKNEVMRKVLRDIQMREFTVVSGCDIGDDKESEDAADKSYGRTEENEESTEEPKDESEDVELLVEFKLEPEHLPVNLKLQPGTKAVVFAWECDWI